MFKNIDTEGYSKLRLKSPARELQICIQLFKLLEDNIIKK